VQVKSGEFVDVAEKTGMANKRFASNVVVADFDNDGMLEVFIATVDADGRGAHNAMFKVIPKSDGGLQIVEISTGDAADPIGLNTALAVGDFDRDGVLDLYLAHGEASRAAPLFLQLKPELPRLHWLRVLVLDEYGAPARGADVLLIQGDRRQRRIIDGGSGFQCQQEPVAHFGLGEDASSPVSLRIRWPNGNEVTIESDIDKPVLVEFNPLDQSVQEYPDLLPRRERDIASESEVVEAASSDAPRDHPQRAALAADPAEPLLKPASMAGGSKSLLSNMLKPKPSPSRSNGVKPAMLPPGLRKMLPPGLRKIIKPAASDTDGTATAGRQRSAMMPPAGRQRSAMIPPSLRKIIKPVKRSA